MNPDSKGQADYKWKTASEFDGSHETLLSMMRLVWNRGHYRHGDESVPLEVSRASAEMTSLLHPSVEFVICELSVMFLEPLITYLFQDRVFPDRQVVQ